MIQGKDICKSFDGFAALDHANINVPQGSIYGLIGPNGAGKTTLLRNLVGIMQPDSGEVTMNGMPVFENVEAKLHIAYIPDNVLYFRQSTMRELKNLYAGLYPTFDHDYYDEIKGWFPDIKDNKPIRRMSKGMQKQIAFILTLSCKTDIIILDEPIDGLDPVMRKQVWRLMLDAVNKYNLTVLLSSHNLRELEDVCDYVGVMHHGKILMERSLLDLQDDIHKIQAAFNDDFMPVASSKFKVLNHSVLGKVQTWIIRGSKEDINHYFQRLNPLFMDQLPLSLEEIFIYELGEENYEIKEFLM